MGVYEWTGDMAKPAASRLIPVSLFIDGKLEDAAVYLARPVPFALLTGNVYELQKAGSPLGTLNLEFCAAFRRARDRDHYLRRWLVWLWEVRPARRCRRSPR